MIFDFNPWQLDIDVDLTKQLYKKIPFVPNYNSRYKRYFRLVSLNLNRAHIA